MGLGEGQPQAQRERPQPTCSARAAGGRCGAHVGQRTRPSPGRGAITAPALLLEDVGGLAPQDAGQ